MKKHRPIKCMWSAFEHALYLGTPALPARYTSTYIFKDLWAMISRFEGAVGQKLSDYYENT